VEQKAPKIVYFLCVDRVTQFDEDNSVMYSAGPINIYPCGYSKKISLTMNDDKFFFLWDHFFIATKEAWGVDIDSIIKIDDFSYEIPLTFEVTLMYFERIIIFWPTTISD